MHEKFISKRLSHFLSRSTIHFYLVKGIEILLQGKMTPLVFHFPFPIPSSEIALIIANTLSGPEKFGEVWFFLYVGSITLEQVTWLSSQNATLQ